MTDNTYAPDYGRQIVELQDEIRDLRHGAAVANQTIAALQPCERSMREALEHVLLVFKSMADRGHYPLELVPLNYSGGGGNVHFLGKQGWQFVTDALAQSQPQPLPGEPAVETIECECCRGVGTIDERLGGYGFSNPAATCPDCDGHGEIEITSSKLGDSES